MFEHKTLIFVFCFLAIFILLVNSIPTVMFSQQSYVAPQYMNVALPDKWSTADIYYQTTPNAAAANLTYPQSMTELIIPVSDIHIQVEWGLGNSLRVFHYYPTFLGLFWVYENIQPWPISETYALYYLIGNVSIINAACSHNQFSIRITFDPATYGSLEEAWDDGHIRFWIAVGSLNNSQLQISYINLFVQLMTFSLPDINPVLNAIIAIPVWIGIFISVKYGMEILKGWL